MTNELIRNVTLEDVVYLKKALNVACITDLSLDIPKLNRIVRSLLNPPYGVPK